MAETAANPPHVIPSHEYHAEAHVLSGTLRRPIEQEIEPHAPTELHGRRSGHLTRVVEDVTIEGLVSFKKGSSRVSGAKSLKHNGWVTLSTSIMEGLNVFEVITADRIVSQVSTDHAYEDGHFPSVTFLGTQFNNLRVSGFPVALELDYAICGEKPAGDQSYLDNFDFLDRVRQRTEQIANADGLPKDLKDQYDKDLATIKAMIDGHKDTEPKITCSLVKSIGPIPIPGVQSFGHVLLIPNFGTVSLGEVEVGEKKYDPMEKRPNNYFEVKSIKIKLGCIGHGNVSGVTAMVNGTHKP
jgi:hypothetical protein